MASNYAAPIPAAPNNTYPMSTYPDAPPYNDPYNATDRRDLARTPSPTPSEQEALSKSGIMKLDLNKYKDRDYWTPRRIIYAVVILIVIVLSVLTVIFHTQIVKWLQPLAKWMHDLKAGWLIPIAIFFVISFPPLFGHEILAVLCGLVWGLGAGFGITAAGTILGELGNYYAFKYLLRNRAAKFEEKKIQYAALAKVIREGGFLVVLICRYSVIPPHLTTALFSTCGIGVLVFLGAAILSLPKQLVTVYMGVLLEQSEEGTSTKTSRTVTVVLVVITTVVTIGAMRYMRKKMDIAKKEIIYQRQKARQAAAFSKGHQPQSSSDSLIPLHPAPEPSDLEAGGFPASVPRLPQAGFDSQAYRDRISTSPPQQYAPPRY